MRNLIILFGMLICLFGPTTVFTLVGYKSLKILSKRPTSSGKVMIALITKLVICAVVLVGILILMLKAFA